MGPDGNEDDGNGIGRRNLLRTTGAAATAGLVPSLAGVASADTTNDDIYVFGDEVETETAHDKHQYYYSISYDYWYRIESTVHCIGGYPTTYEWESTYRVFAYGAARKFNPSTETPKEGDPINVIDEHKVTFVDSSDGPDGEIEYSNDHDRVGGWPTPEYTALEMAEDGLEEVAKVAMGSLSDVAELAIAYYQTFEKWSQEKDVNTVDTEEEKEFRWYYGDGWTSDEHADVGHFAEVDFQQPLDTHSHFFAETEMFDGTVNPAVNWKIHSHSPSSTSSTTTSSDPTGREVIESMSPEQRRAWGLKKVPVDTVEKLLGKKVEDPVMAEKDKMWYATTPDVQFERASPKEK